MPFAREFDDVYTTIKGSVEGASPENPLRCFRLDESRPAGRITDRLTQEIQSASLCVADLTGNKPNVMWEVGYAMALGKPTIIITQEKGELPFDIRVMETLRYDRNHLSETLGHPLRRTTIDTMSTCSLARDASAAARPVIQDEFVGELLEQIRELRNIVSQAVKTWNPAVEQTNFPRKTMDNLSVFEGAWVNLASHTHYYGQVVDDQLVMPYCYGGNERITSVYYGWRKAGDLSFARYCWFASEISGFAFLKQETVDLLSGAWWADDESKQIPENPLPGSGISLRWERDRSAQIPGWALQFFEEVRRVGLVNCLTSRCSGPDRPRRFS
jgi:nucleoside 2-deoxyribosyltransferase